MKWRTNIFVIAVLLVTTIDGIALDCTYGMVSFSRIGSIYTCTARVLHDENVNENATAVFGIHQTGKGHEDVYGVQLRTQNLQFVPTNIEYFFPNIIAIDLYDNNIPSISNRHLIPFSNLQYLSLYGNNLTSINGDLFSGLDSMKFITFNTNNIRHVGHDLNLPINGGISFAKNSCIDQIASTPDAVAELKLNLLRNCPPTISQIEDSLQRRPNWLTHIDSQVQSLIKNGYEINDELPRLRNEQVQLWDVVYGLMNRIENLEAIIGSKVDDKSTIQLLIDTLGRDD